MLEPFTPEVPVTPTACREPSRTALAAAYMRAAHQLLDARPLLLEDPVAVQLLGPEAARSITEAPESHQTPLARALRAHVALRSRYAEDQLRAAVEGGATTYVLVGAGFDTFALRQPPWAGGLRIVEVDHPATQALKRARIQDAGLDLPANVHFAGLDFERETLAEGLRRHGLATEARTFFSWLGVTMYLTEPAIDANLRAMAAFPQGSQTVLTFSQPPDPDSQGSLDIASQIAERVASVGEPFLSRFEPEAMTTKLLAAGFTQVDLLSREEALKLYFRDGHRDLAPPRRIGFASAIR
jgi:methyltransferase (TIGR00027 family)